MRVVGVLAIVISAAALAACAPSQSAEPSATPSLRSTDRATGSAEPSTSPSPTATPTPTPGAGYNADGSLLITPTSVGIFTIDDTVADVAAVTGVDYSEALTQFGGECGSVTVSETGQYASIYALAASDGALGHIDTFGTYLPGGGRAATAEGIGMGSTEDDLLAAYGNDLEHKPDFYQEDFTEYWIHGDDDTAMTFTVDDTGVVAYWEVGRVEQLEYPEGCA